MWKTMQNKPLLGPYSPKLSPGIRTALVYHIWLRNAAAAISEVRITALTIVPLLDQSMTITLGEEYESNQPPQPHPHAVKFKILHRTT